MNDTVVNAKHPRLVRLAHCQVPVPIAEVYGVPKNKVLINSRELRPTSQLLQDLGLSLVMDQYFPLAPIKRNQSLNIKKGVVKKRSTIVIDSSSSSDSDSDSSDSDSSGSSFNLESSFLATPTIFTKALRSMGIFTRTIEQEKAFLELWADVMANSVKHLSWARHTLHRCESCTFKASSKVTVLAHMDRGHMNYKKKTVSCAYRHKPRVTTNNSNAFQTHMRQVHNLEVLPVLFRPDPLYDDFVCQAFVPPGFVDLSPPDSGLLRPLPSDINFLFFRDDFTCARLYGSLAPKFLCPNRPPELPPSAVVSQLGKKSVIIRSCDSADRTEEPPAKKRKQSLISVLSEGPIFCRSPLSAPLSLQPFLTRPPAPPPPPPPKPLPTPAPTVFRPLVTLAPRAQPSMLASRGVSLFRKASLKPVMPNPLRLAGNIYCELCNSITHDRLPLLEHLKLKHNKDVTSPNTPTGRGPFACKNCDKKFWTSEGLETHISRCHPVPRTICPICNASFEKRSIYSHMVASHNEHFEEWLRTGRCFLCNNSPNQPFDLPRHWASVHNMRLIHCLTSRGKQRLFVPTNNSPFRMPHPPIVKLPPLPASSSSPPVIVLDDDPPEESPAPVPVKKLRCPKPFCRRTFANADEQIRHLINDHSKQQRRCHLCPDFSAASAMAWNEHMQKEHPQVDIDAAVDSPSKRGTEDMSPLSVQDIADKIVSPSKRPAEVRTGSPSKRSVEVTTGSPSKRPVEVRTGSPSKRSVEDTKGSPPKNTRALRSKRTVNGTKISLPNQVVEDTVTTRPKRTANGTRASLPNSVAEDSVTTRPKRTAKRTRASSPIPVVEDTVTTRPKRTPKTTRAPSPNPVVENAVTTRPKRTAKRSTKASPPISAAKDTVASTPKPAALDRRKKKQPQLSKQRKKKTGPAGQTLNGCSPNATEVDFVRINGFAVDEAEVVVLSD